MCIKTLINPRWIDTSSDLNYALCRLLVTSLTEKKPTNVTWFQLFIGFFFCDKSILLVVLLLFLQCKVIVFCSYIAMVINYLL